jgi:hypothetical protein
MSEFRADSARGVRCEEESCGHGAAWFEILAGAVFLTAPEIPCHFIFADTPDNLDIALVRFAGIALAGLGLACLPLAKAEPSRMSVIGLFAFNAGVVIFLVGMGTEPALCGILLLPAANLHALIAAVLLRTLLKRDSIALQKQVGFEYGQRQQARDDRSSKCPKLHAGRIGACPCP